jgi:hypothetical protein
MAFLISCSIAGPSNAPIPATTQSSQLAPNAESFGTSSIITSTPSATPSPSPTANQTDAALHQIIVVTQSVIQTRIAQFPRFCKDFYIPRQFSPDDLWLEELCYSDEDQGPAMTLSNSKTRHFWKLLYRDYIPKMEYPAEGGMSVAHWSNDRRFTYFYSYSIGDGGECFYTGLDRGFGLFRLNLQTGQVTTILPTNEEFWWYGFSVSPIDNYLVYGERARDLKILDIESGKSMRVNSVNDFEEGGGFVWSPDGLKFVYSTVMYSSNHTGIENYSLRLVDAQSRNERVLLESGVDCFLAISWNEDDILTVKDYGVTYEPTLIEIDLNSNNVTNATATP